METPAILRQPDGSVILIYSDKVLRLNHPATGGLTCVPHATMLVT